MSEINPSELPELIRLIRQHLGLSQKKFASRLGVSFQTVNRWENGHTTPSQLALKLLKQELEEMGPLGTELRQRYFKE